MLNNLAYGIVVGILFISLGILFCVMFGKLYIHKITNYTKVIYEKDLTFQRELNSTIIETQEQVLNNISRDLHDDAGQQLTAINFQLENLKLDSPELEKILDPISESVSGLAKSIRSISHSLNNQLLTKQDLFKAIAAEVERLQKNIPIAIELQIDNDSKSFTANQKMVIYRIFQEIINNILKHAQARNVKIDIATTPVFKMAVTDDGKGFETATVGDATNGLQNMIQRAALINYEVFIQSKPTQGTTIILTANKP